jgi:hypothetical protein
MDFFQSRILYLVIALELLDDEFGIRTELDFRGAERQRAFDAQKRSGILRDIVGRLAEVLETAFDGNEFGSADIDSQSRWPRISTGPAVRIHDEFFHMANGRLFGDIAPEILEFPFQRGNLRQLLDILRNFLHEVF